MIHRIIEWSLQARVLVVVLAAAFVFFGSGQIREMPVDTLPEFTPPTVEVQTEALGLSAAEVEQLITVPLEQNFLNGVAFLETIRSESIPGLSSIVLVFEPGTDIFNARQVVQERLTAASTVLPKVSKPPQMLQPLSSQNRVMMIGLSSDELSLIQMSILSRWTIKPQLQGLEGVANVAIYGQRERQLQVQVDPARLRERGVSLEQVIQTTGNALWVSPLTFLEASSPGSGGFIDTANQRLEIQHIQPISSPADLARVPIDGSSLRLGDVAEVVEDHQPLIGDAVVNDGEGLLLVVEKFPEANTLEVSREVEKAIDGMRPGLSGVELDTTIFRPATSIENGLDDLRLAGLIGLGLAVLVLMVLFVQWRTALISLAAIPLSLVAAALVLDLRGETFNVMVLAGLLAALALLIDDVVTDADNIARRLRRHRKDGGTKSTASVIVEAALETRNALVYGTLILLVALAPVFFLQGLSDEFFPPLGTSYVLAVLASMVVALTVTPALSVILFAVAPERSEPPADRLLQRGHVAALTRILSVPRALFFAGVGVIAVVGLAAVPLLSQPSLLPSFEDRDMLIHLDGAPGTSRPEMARITTQVSGELRSTPGVKNVGAHVGRAITSDQVNDVNAGELWVSIDADADYGKTKAAIQSVVDGYPGLDRNVVSYPEERIGEVLKGTDEDIIVRVYGEDLEVLRTKAEEVRRALTEIDGVVEGRLDLPLEEATVEIEVDLAAARAVGIKPGDARRAAATLLSGVEVGSLFEQQKVFEVIVVGTPETRHSLTSIRELPIDRPDGGQVRLADIADVRIAANPNVIEREAVSRGVDVIANVDGRDVGAARGDVERALKNIEFPLEYHATLLDQDGGTSWQRIATLAVAAALAIFLLLQAAYGSWRLAALAFVTLPIALVGGVLAALADGGDVTIGSYAGFLALLGIAARNGVVLLHRYERLELEEGNAFGQALVLRGAQERVAPILMTALATVVALLPLVLIGDIFGHEVVQPMAIVILGGLVTSTLLNLFIMPALYLYVAPGPETAASRAPLSTGGVQPVPSAGGGGS